MILEIHLEDSLVFFSDLDIQEVRDLVERGSDRDLVVDHAIQLVERPHIHQDH